MGKSVNAQGKETASKDMQGQLAKAQASQAEGSTVSLEDSIKPIELRPTVKLVHPRHPDQEFTGDQAWQLINRGLMYDQAQSERDKLKERNTFLETQLRQLQTDKEARERDESIRRRVQEMLPNQATASKRTSEEDSGLSDYLTDSDENTGQPPQLDIDKLLAGLSAIQRQEVQKSLGEHEASFQQRLEDLFNKRAEQEQLSKRQTAWLEQIKEAKIRGLKMQYPNISDSIIKEAVEFEDAASYDALRGLQLFQEGNEQGAMDIYFDGEEKKQKAIQLRQAMIKRQHEYDVQSRNEAELEGLSRGVLPSDTGEEEPVKYNKFNSKESAKVHANRLKRAKEMVKRIAIASGALPEE